MGDGRPAHLPEHLHPRTAGDGSVRGPNIATITAANIAKAALAAALAAVTLAAAVATAANAASALDAATSATLTATVAAAALTAAIATAVTTTAVTTAVPAVATSITTSALATTALSATFTTTAHSAALVARATPSAVTTARTAQPTTPPPPPLAPCVERGPEHVVPLNFSATTTPIDNLGGLINSTERPVLRYHNIGEFGGHIIDLEVSNMSEYRSWRPTNNGIQYKDEGAFGVINLQAPRPTNDWAQEPDPSKNFTGVPRNSSLSSSNFDSGIVGTSNLRATHDTTSRSDLIRTSSYVPNNPSMNGLRQKPNRRFRDPQPRRPTE